jgi:hypothetical protein
MTNDSDDSENIPNHYAHTTDRNARRCERYRFTTTRGRLESKQDPIHEVCPSPAELAPRHHLLGRVFMMVDFMCSIALFLASSAPGGFVAKVPVVCASSLHPHTRQTDASAVGRIKLPIKNDVAFERIGHLSIVVSAEGPWRFAAEPTCLEQISARGASSDTNRRIDAHDSPRRHRIGL